MKKHNDGYALVLVLVVMVVLCLIALALMSNSLRNLQSQQKSIDRMEDKYAAEGAVEIVVAQLNALDCNVANVGADAASVCNSASSEATTVALSDGVLTQFSEGIGNDSFTYTFKLTVKSGTVQVICEMELEGEIGADGKITSPKTTYLSYEISNTGGDAG